MTFYLVFIINSPEYADNDIIKDKPIGLEGPSYNLLDLGLSGDCTNGWYS